jgi:hypothetical protein
VSAVAALTTRETCRVDLHELDRIDTHRTTATDALHHASAA